MKPPVINPRRGEVWRVQLEPARGSEQGKARPMVVLSEPPIGRPTIRLCAPIVHAKPEHLFMAWCIELYPDADNGLTKDSTADAAQTRALDLVRFETRLGKVSEQKLEAITTALILCVGRQPAPPATDQQDDGQAPEKAGI
jgi:mRNA interferase MazF